MVVEIKEVESRVEVLDKLIPNPCGVTDLVRRLRWQTRRVLSLLEMMELEGLVKSSKSQDRIPGRPKKVITPTPLGHELLESFRQCQNKVIQINDNDIKRAIYQSQLSERLVKHDISPYRRMMELSSLAFNLRDSANPQNYSKTS